MLTYSFYESDTRVRQYASALAERGDSVDVIALRRAGTPATEVLNNVRVFRIQSRTVNERGRLSYLFRILRFFLTSSFFLTRKHLSDPYEIIHVHSVPDFLVFAALMPKLLGARVILDIHDILPEFYASKFGVSSDSFVYRLLLLVEKFSIAFSHHVIIANHLWRERLISRSTRAEKCTVFINYPDPTIFYPRKKNSTAGTFLILYPGSLNHHQGLDIAIWAFALVADKMSGAEFHIYGDGPAKPALKQLTSDLGLKDRVIFHNSVSTEGIAQMMANADLAIVPKRAGSSFGNEAASTKIMEFMALGVPLIVSRTNIDSYYYDDSNVKFFESENVEELANSMYMLWGNPRVRKEYAANANRYVELNKWEHKKADYFRLVDQLTPIPTVDSKSANQC